MWAIHPNSTPSSPFDLPDVFNHHRQFLLQPPRALHLSVSSDSFSIIAKIGDNALKKGKKKRKKKHRNPARESHRPCPTTSTIVPPVATFTTRTRKSNQDNWTNLKGEFRNNMSAVWYVPIFSCVSLFFHVYLLIAWGGEQSYDGRAGAADSPIVL